MHYKKSKASFSLMDLKSGFIEVGKHLINAGSSFVESLESFVVSMRELGLTVICFLVYCTTSLFIPTKVKKYKGQLAFALTSVSLLILSVITQNIFIIAISGLYLMLMFGFGLILYFSMSDSIVKHANKLYFSALIFFLMCLGGYLLS